MTSWSPAPSRCTCTSALRRARPRRWMPRCAPGSRSSRRAREEAIPKIVDHERSEEHTSELQSHSDLVCRLLLEKKKKKKKKKILERVENKTTQKLKTTEEANNRRSRTNV